MGLMPAHQIDNQVYNDTESEEDCRRRRARHEVNDAVAGSRDNEVLNLRLGPECPVNAEKYNECQGEFDGQKRKHLIITYTE